MESDRADGVGADPAETLELIDPRDGDAPSDALLLQRFINLRDEEAFADLVRRHQGLVMNVAWRILRNVQAAEDAFQETFLALARRARTVRVPDSLAGWLHRVAANAALQIRIRGQRRHARESLAGAAEAIRPAPPEFDDLTRLVDKTLDEMPEKYRLPLILCYLQGLTNETAAVRLGRPKGSMSTLIARGLELLRNGLQKKGVVAAPGALIAAVLGSQAQAATPAVVASVLRAATAAGLGSTAVSGAAGWMVAAELKAAVAAALLAAGAVGGGLFALPPAEPLPAAVATVLPPPAAPPRRAAAAAAPSPSDLRPAVPAPASVPESSPAVGTTADAPPEPEPNEERTAGKADAAPGPRPAEELPPLPDLPLPASDQARAALERALDRRLERGPAGAPPSLPAAAKASSPPKGPPSGARGLERASEASRAASSAAEHAHQAVQQTRGRSGK